MKKNDWLLALTIIIMSGIGFVLFFYLGTASAGLVKITVDGEIYGTYSLETNQEIKINHTNRLVIKDGNADMTDADCPDHICVNHMPISKNKETIVCLPNKVIVEIVGGEDAELDAVVK